jgi:hypothetical protein
VVTKDLCGVELAIVLASSNSYVDYMLLNIAFVLIALWLIGFIIFPIVGFLIHILLVIAIIMILMRIIRGK